MIPKKIHYVWMGGKAKPKKIQKCIKTWKRKLKDYEFIEWNESNFDINSHPFVKAAYDNKKWAFVSDYVRAWAIYNYGGIYLDTDVYVIRKLDKLLDNKAFVGFERSDYPFTAVFGACKHHSFIKDMLDYYDGLDSYSFNFNDNNTLSVSKLLIDKYNCKRGNVEQLLKTGIKVYRDDILCNPSNSSITIHLFFGSWTGNTSFERKKHEFLRSKLSNKFNIWLYCLYKNIKLKIKRKKIGKNYEKKN